MGLIENDTSRVSRKDFLRLMAMGGVSIVIPQDVIQNLNRYFRPEKSVREKSSNTELAELLPHEKVTGIVKSKAMPVWMFPVTPSGFYDYWKVRGKVPASYEKYLVDNVDLSYLNVFYAQDTQNRISRYTILPHTTGQRGIPIGLLDQGKIVGGNYVADSKYYSENTVIDTSSKEKSAAHTILAEFYPNKLHNILEAMKAINDFQQLHGGFISDREYSMWEILNTENRKGYLPGFNSARKEVVGGGVCVTATNICKLMIMLGGKFTEQWGHPTSSRYSSSIFAGETLSPKYSDATVDKGTDRIFDLKFIPPESGFISLSANIIPNGKEVKSPLGDNNPGGEKADAAILATFRWTKTNPGDRSASFTRLQESYAAYRNGGQNPPLALGGLFLGETPWQEDGTSSNFLRRIAPEERVERFREELGKNRFLSDLVQLRNLINSYNPKSSQKMGAFLKNSGWYTSQTARLGDGTKERDLFESALRHLDRYTHLVEGQPIQCVGFAILMASLSDPSISFRHIGGATRESDGQPVASAAELVPQSIRKGTSSSVRMDGRNIRTVNSLEEIEPGDLFVQYHTEAGHVGVVVGKKVVDGKTVLLFAAGNQESSGKVKIFEVDGSNFDLVLGPYPYQKVIIR